MSSRKKTRKKATKKATKSKSSKRRKSKISQPTEKDAILKNITELESQIKVLQDEKNNSKSELEQLKIIIKESSGSVEKYQKMIQALQKEVTDLLQDLDTADIEIDEYIKAKDELALRNEFVEKELLDKQTLLETRNKQFETLAHDYEQVYKKLIEQDKKKKTRKTTKKSRKKMNVDSLGQLQEQVKQIEKLERKLKSKDEEIDELINRLEIQEIRIEELEEEIESEMKSRLRLERAYNKVKGKI